jgi:PIN domain nuclease of toxin-antitoxin system
MDYLLDTHVVLWLAGNSPRMSPEAKRVIFDQASEKFVSIVSAWEVAIKCGMGRLNLTGGAAEFFRMAGENGFTLLPIEKKHVEQVQSLPFLHRDPFDRMLVAAAVSERIGLITADENIRLYDIPSIW